MLKSLAHTFAIAASLNAVFADTKVQFGTPVEFRGMCDASAAVTSPLGILVLDDEEPRKNTNESAVIRFYDFANPRHTAHKQQIQGATLKLETAHPEIDMEGAAVSGNRLYIIGSHSRRNQSGKAVAAPNRRRLFAVEWPPNAGSIDLIINGKPYFELLEDLQAYLKQHPSPEVSNLVVDAESLPKEQGASIEGLAAAPDGSLLVGFRNPIPGSKALIVKLRNPARVLAGEHADFDEPTLLSLGGHGLRDIVWLADRREYLILSGPAASDPVFAIYRWSGIQSDQPMLVASGSRVDHKLSPKVSPEAILPVEGSGTFWLLFDEGSRQDSVECKDAAEGERSFHAVSVTGLLDNH